MSTHNIIKISTTKFVINIYASFKNNRAAVAGLRVNIILLQKYSKFQQKM